jgi:outer membrane protein assembly factor BamA
LYRKQYYGGALFSINVDTRNNEVLPEKGINWITNAKYLAGLNKFSYDNVLQINSDFIFYLKLVQSWLCFANRTGAGITLSNAYEFYHSQFLGSDENLRGYRKDRFAGKTKFYNQAELRLKLFNMRTYLFPASLGVFTFFDAGRVWVKNDTDNKFLTGYGGGIWFSPLRRFVFTVSYAISNEDKIPLAGLSWKF